jgi:ubiquinone/menaquinone biosynthesis C-methylase UbiE
MNSPTPDWQLPPGVDRGLWDYLHSGDMVANYDAQMAIAPLATADVRFCERVFDPPGRLIDLGCGTGRLARPFLDRGFHYLGVDLSDEMLAAAREANPDAEFRKANLVDLDGILDASFDWAACLFSTLGMIRGAENRQAALRSFHRVLKPGGTLALHVHNRWFHGLGLQILSTADKTMPQAYGGAPLTLHHYSRREIRIELASAGFAVETIAPVGRGTGGRLSIPGFCPMLRAYGYLIAARKPSLTAK